MTPRDYAHKAQQDYARGCLFVPAVEAAITEALAAQREELAKAVDARKAYDDGTSDPYRAGWNAACDDIYLRTIRGSKNG